MKLTLNVAHVFPLKTLKNDNPEVFTLDGSNKTHSTNVLERVSTTWPRLALVRYQCDRSRLFCLWS